MAEGVYFFFLLLVVVGVGVGGGVAERGSSERRWCGDANILPNIFFELFFFGGVSSGVCARVPSHESPLMFHLCVSSLIVSTRPSVVLAAPLAHQMPSLSPVTFLFDT